LTNLTVIQERIQKNKALVERYTSVLYIFIFTGLGIILGSSLTSYLYSTPILITVIATFVVFAAVTLIALAISGREEEVAIDNMIMSSRRRRSNRNVSEALS
jgi:FtsH-binding integral membrane protein